MHFMRCTLAVLLSCASPWTLAHDKNAPEHSNASVHEATPLIVDEYIASGLSLADLQGIALANSPALQKTNALIHAAQGRAYQAGRRPNPNIGLDFQQLFSDGQAEQYGVTLDQTIVRKEKIATRQAVAIREIQQLRQKLITDQRRLEAAVHIAYLKTLRAQREIDVRSGLLKINKDAKEFAQKLLEADEIAQTDILQIELEVASAEMRLLDARSRHEGTWRALAGLVNDPSLSPQPLGGDLFAEAPEIDFDIVLQQLVSGSPQVGELTAKIERARCFLAKQQAEPLKDVSVRGLLNWRDNGVDGEPNVGLALSIPWAINDKNSGAIQEARYLLAASQRELEQLIVELRNRLAPVYQDYASSKIQADALRQVTIPKATRTLEIIQKTYQQGEASFISLLTAQRTYAELLLSQVDALEKIQIANARMAGFLLPD